MVAMVRTVLTTVLNKTPATTPFDDAEDGEDGRIQEEACLADDSDEHLEAGNLSQGRCRYYLLSTTVLAGGRRPVRNTRCSPGRDG